MQEELQREFQSRMDEHHKIVYKICRLYCFDQTDREDLGQEILVQLWRSYPKFDGRCLFSTWMYRIALNTAVSYIRSEATRKRHFGTKDPLFLESLHVSEMQSEEVRSMYRLIANLDPLNRALAFIFLDGNSYEEIALIMGLTVTNVATKINRLKNTMKHAAAGPKKGNG